VEIDGETTPLVPHRAAARGDGFVVLAKKAESDAFDDPIVVLTLDARGAIAAHRVLNLGNVLGAPTRLQAFGDEWVFAAHINDPENESPVRIVALDGLEHRVLVSVGSGSSHIAESGGSLSYGTTTTATTVGFRLSDMVPLSQALFLITGQSTLEVTSTDLETLAEGSLGASRTDSEPKAVLVSTAGETRPLAIPDNGYGMVVGAAAQDSEFMTVSWTGSSEFGATDLFVNTFDAQFEPGDAFRLDRPSHGFEALYRWGAGFLLYGHRGADRGDTPARLYITVVGGRPASGARSAQDIDIGQDLPRDGGAVQFVPAFLGSVQGQGLIAVAATSRTDGETSTERAYLGRLGSGDADRWEMEVGTRTYNVRPLALNTNGTLLTAHRDAFGAPMQLELVTLAE